MFRDLPRLLARDLPEGPIRESQKELRRLAERPHRVPIRWAIGLSRLPESVFRGLCIALVAALGLWYLWLNQQILNLAPGFAPVNLIFGNLLIAAVAARFLYAMATEQSRLVSTRSVTPWPISDRVLAFGGAAYSVTAAFAVISAVLISQGWLAVQGARSTDTNLVFQAFATFLWNLGDIIPLLELTETLHWEPALTFPTVGGGTLVLLYKLALILPAAQVLALAAGLWTGAHATTGASREQEGEGVTSANVEPRPRD
jgi:hypothetical protein